MNARVYTTEVSAASRVGNRAQRVMLRLHPQPRASGSQCFLGRLFSFICLSNIFSSLSKIRSYHSDSRWTLFFSMTYRANICFPIRGTPSDQLHLSKTVESGKYIIVSIFSAKILIILWYESYCKERILGGTHIWSDSRQYSGNTIQAVQKYDPITTILDELFFLMTYRTNIC